jgi:hypothetical protein
MAAGHGSESAPAALLCTWKRATMDRSTRTAALNNGPSLSVYMESVRR